MARKAKSYTAAELTEMYVRDLHRHIAAVNALDSEYAKAKNELNKRFNERMRFYENATAKPDDTPLVN